MARLKGHHLLSSYTPYLACLHLTSAVYDRTSCSNSNVVAELEVQMPERKAVVTPRVDMLQAVIQAVLEVNQAG